LACSTRRAQQPQGAGSDRDPPLGPGLGHVPVEERLAGENDAGAGDQDVALVEVHIGPAQAAQLTAAGTQHHGQNQE
jgi:hypothetical protein